MKSQTVLRVLATLLQQINNLYQKKDIDTETMLTRAESVFDKIKTICSEFMPSGSGIDRGSILDVSSHEDRIIFDAPFHHMDDDGGYAGWTNHKIIIKPSLTQCYTIRVTGKDRDQVKEYLAQAFDIALQQRIIWDKDSCRYVSAQDH